MSLTNRTLKKECKLKVWAFEILEASNHKILPVCFFSAKRLWSLFKPLVVNALKWRSITILIRAFFLKLKKRNFQWYDCLLLGFQTPQPLVCLLVSATSQDYSNTGCGVFKQNWKAFCLKINIPIGNYWMLSIGVVASRQKLGIILVIKGFKNWCYQKMSITKNVVLNWYS